MKKSISLIKAVMSQDMELFKYKAKANSSSMTKILTPIILGSIIMLSIGAMFFSFAEMLNEASTPLIILAISTVLPCMLAVMEGVYKSQSVLFEAKDTEMLFALPISKKMILVTRILKLYVFQLLYSLLMIVPGIVVYAYFAKPNVYFYIITIINTLLLPIIPTIIGSAIGFVIKRVSNAFKAKKAVELVLSMVFILGVMAISYNSTQVQSAIIENANKIMETIKMVYYPIGAYLDLVNGFNIVTCIGWILISIIPFAIFIILASRKYFSLVSKSNEKIKKSEEKNKKSTDKVEYSFKKNTKMKALVKKEFSKYFSSNVYIVNTMFSLVLLVIATIALVVNYDAAIQTIFGESDAEQLQMFHSYAPNIYMVIVIALSFMTSITSSAISIEGKTFNISKSLPVGTKKLLQAKILMSSLITIPVILICDVIFFSRISFSLVDFVLILAISFIAPTIAAAFGLLVNLKFPKMDASSDTEVVKQSTSSLVAVSSGIIFAIIFLVITLVFAMFGDFAMIAEIALLGLILVGLLAILFKYGQKRYKEIEA